MRLRDNAWGTEEQLSDLDRDEMDRDFFEEEVKQVIDSMEKNKAAGSDGFPIEFYQACWPIVKHDML